MGKRINTEGYKENFALVEMLKVCARNKDLSQGAKLHRQIMERGLLSKSPYIASALINMYAKCGMLAIAQQLLESLSIRTVVSFNAMIAGYAQQEQGHEALDCFERMQREGLSPNAVTFTCILNACGTMGAFDKGKEIHDKIVDCGMLDKDVLLGNALVDMYAKCGALSKAQQVLEELNIRNVVTWNTLIAGYAQCDQGHEALNCFQQMQKEGLSPDGITFACALKACGCICALDEGQRIHNEIVDRGLLEKNVVVGNALVDMYAKCGMLAKSRQVLEELPIKNVVSWSAVISGYALEGQYDEALECFETMQREGHTPNDVSFISILKACSNIGAISKGKQIHNEIVNRGFLDKSIALGNALIDMYVKCAVLEKAQKVLKELSCRDTVSWSTMIAGYSQDGQGNAALNCFEQMQTEGHEPDLVTYVCILKACGNAGAIETARKIHDEVVSQGLLKESVELGNALVDVYAKSGDLAKAKKVLEELPIRDIVSWNTIIAGYVQHEQGHEALNCLELMEKEHIFPNGVTFTCILKACTDIGAIDKGRHIHDEIISRGLLEKNIVLGTALVDMYAQCGMLAKAHKVLEELHFRDVVAWSTLIAGYAQAGQLSEAMRCFSQMQREGLSPDDVTFVSMLNACSHSGKLDEAQAYYEDMNRKYGIKPKLEHHTCMVVTFGYVGRFDKAVSVIKTMPFSDDPSVWVALLSACRKRGNVKLGKLAFEQAMVLDDSVCAAYVLMANTYAAAGMQKDAEIVETMRLGKEASKKQLLRMGTL